MPGCFHVQRFCRSFRLLSLYRNLHRHDRGLQVQQSNQTPIKYYQTYSTAAVSNQHDQIHQSCRYRSFSTSLSPCSFSVTGSGVPHEDDYMLSYIPPILDVGYHRELIIPFAAGVDVQVGTNYVRFYSGEADVPEKPTDFTFLIDDPQGVQDLSPGAIRRGEPQDKNDVWLVNQEWIDTTDSPLPDPCSVINSDPYNIHLEQVLYATNSVTMESGDPAVKEELDCSKIPFAAFSDENIDGTTMVWMDCMRIQRAILENWRNARGRRALETLMGKANLVCTATAATYGFRKTKQLTEVDTVGGSSYYDGGCTVSYTILDKEQDLDSRIQRQVVLKAQKTWSRKKYWQGRYTPDVQLRSVSQSSSTACITGEVTSYKPKRSDLRRAWNQALIGLKDKETTYAVIVSPKEAMIFKIEVDGDTVNTSQRKYPLISSSSVGPQQIKNFFRDLVLIIWDSAYNEIIN